MVRVRDRAGAHTWRHSSRARGFLARAATLDGPQGGAGEKYLSFTPLPSSDLCWGRRQGGEARRIDLEDIFQETSLCPGKIILADSLSAK